MPNTPDPRTEPVAPDVDLGASRSRGEPPERLGPVLLAVSVGGALGALARWGVAQTLPPVPGTFPWPVYVVNVVGCFAIGILMVAIAGAGPRWRLVRPFLGTGVLGGYTTFATAMTGTARLVESGEVATALSYLAGTLASALLAVWAGSVLAESVLRRRSHPREAPTPIGRHR
ncbi:fluoride efflux transporter FluC [Salinactinospora qingdaonensis]|uniref:Fluoride-specific ion channel FluC n=1 Tax=Salinactinospora qingdaonensis TaxID=702744 RepID=A0ABP7F9L6_9ACTN